jgi:processive 1,2-diacylglycerol beta-glucosyltransferase
VKKISIFTCIGGHTTVSTALQDSLNASYNVEVKNIFLDILKPIDFVRTLTFNRYSVEDLYSFILKKQWHTLMNIALIKVGYCFFSLRRKKILSLISNYLNQHKPDLIISVIPFFNNCFALAAKQMNIPFILVPTDVDLSTFIYNMSDIEYKKLYLCLPLLKDTIIQNQLKSTNIEPSNISIAGAPLKNMFFEQQDIQAIKKKFAIAQHKPVILLLMGSQGAASLYLFAQEIAKVQNIPFHLIIVLGNSSEQKSAIEELIFGPAITTTIFGFTPYIAQLMAISDLLITKSGGISICEAIYMNLPLILDGTSNILLWERLNQELVVNNNFGMIVKKMSDLPTLITHLLSDKHQLEY